MSKQQSSQVDPSAAADSEVVAAAARLLVEAARSAGDTADGAAPAPPGATPAAPSAAGSPARDLRAEPAIAEIHEEIASVQTELNAVSSGVLGLQAHGLRQTGIAALVLAVLIAIAWKVIGG
jgi:hypothetical protein